LEILVLSKIANFAQNFLRMANKKKATGKAPVKKNVVAKPAKKAAKPVAKKTSKPVAKKATKVVKKAAKPVSKKVTKPIAKKAAKPLAKKITKPAAKKVAKPVAKKTAKPAPKKAVKPAPKKTVKPVAKKVAKPVVKKASKPIAKKVAKPAPKKAVKPAPKKAVKPVAKKAVLVVPKISNKPAPKKVVAKPAKKETKVKELKKATPAPAVKAPVEKVSKRVPKEKVKKVIREELPAKALIIMEKPSIVAPEPTKETKNLRYSDEELREFKGIIDGKLASARQELVNLKDSLDSLTQSQEGNKSWNMEEGSDASEMEYLMNQVARQNKFIRDLEMALVRIENKTYGVCRATGKLIDKKRLRIVPHATLSIDAKNTRKSDDVTQAPNISTTHMGSEGEGFAHED